MGFGAQPYTLTKADIDAVLGYDVSAHEPRHADSGADQIDAGDLVAGADPRSSAHASRHASGEADEVTPAAIGAIAITGEGLKGWHQQWTEYIDQGGAVAPDIIWDTDQVTFRCRDDADELRVYSDSNSEPFAWTRMRMILRLRRDIYGTDTVEAYIVLTSGNVDVKSVLDTAGYVGFKYIGNDLSAITGGESGSTVTSLGETLADATWVEARYINGSRVEFYVDGVLKAVHTTNIPSATPGGTRLVYQVLGTFDGIRSFNSSKPILTYNHETDYITDLPSDQKVSGRVVRGQAGENLAIFEVCYMKSDGKLWKAQADAAATMPALYMATEAILADAYGTFLTDGYARDDSWNWTVGAILHAFDDTAGAMIQTAPSDTGDQVQRVGIAVTADVVFFKPDITMVEIA